MGKHTQRRVSIEGFRPASNPEHAHWMRERRRSSAASRHIPAPRKGTRSQSERDGVRDQRDD